MRYIRKKIKGDKVSYFPPGSVERSRRVKRQRRGRPASPSSGEEGSSVADALPQPQPHNLPGPRQQGIPPFSAAGPGRAPPRHPHALTQQTQRPPVSSHLPRRNGHRPLPRPGRGDGGGRGQIKGAGLGEVLPPPRGGVSGRGAGLGGVLRT